MKNVNQVIFLSGIFKKSNNLLFYNTTYQSVLSGVYIIYN